MTYRYLGRSGLKVSRLALGTMMFGGPTDEKTSHEIIARAKSQGINFIDTADVYQKGVTEQVVGRALAADRNDWVLATKFGNPLGEGPNRAGTSRKWIIESVENSLRRLGTDYIDLLYFHRADFDAPPGEAVRAIGDLIRAGKLRYFGLSNFRGWRIAEVAHLADAEGIDRPIASQPLYNIVNRTAEAEQLPAAAAYGLGVVSYSPLARGVLTAKYPSLKLPILAHAPHARTSACWRPSGVLNPLTSLPKSNSTPTRATSAPSILLWPGCSTTA
jgi:aryl-alcohol dehydrogenase-like predicted oxidoreductase